MAGTRTHALPHGVALDRTAESATAVLRDWDVHITTILDDQGEVRVRAHDPRSLDAGVTMLRGNAHRALAARHYLPPPIGPAPAAPPHRRRVRQFAATSAVIALLTAGTIVLRLSGENDSSVRVVVMPFATETVTVSNPQGTTAVNRPDSGSEKAADQPVSAGTAVGTITSTRTLASGTPVARPPATRAARFTTPAKDATPTSGTTATPSEGGTGSGPTEAPRSESGPGVSIVARSPSSPDRGPWNCANSSIWTSSGCSSGAALGQSTRR
ncbi:MAG: hypothetical protein M3252_02935 [Actinomycetota bacterium]|nr:hypothetical protein [Actinomycetota bacterium]